MDAHSTTEDIAKELLEFFDPSMSRPQLAKKIREFGDGQYKDLLTGMSGVEYLYRMMAKLYCLKNGRVWSDKYGIFIRPDAWDHGIASEARTYLPMGMSAGDVVCDIGGNIGTFAKLAIDSGAAEVITYEPDPQNFASLLANHLDNWDKVLAKRMAVVGSDDKAVSFYINEKGSNKGLHSTVAHRGRPTFQVPAISFENVMKPLYEESPFTALKIDIEGGEYNLPLEQIPASVTKLAIEWHLARQEFKDLAKYGDVLVRSLGFIPIRPLVVGDRSRAYLAVYRR